MLVGVGLDVSEAAFAALGNKTGEDKDNLSHHMQRHAVFLERASNTHVHGEKQVAQNCNAGGGGISG